jgi:hypothetical protein
MTAQERGMTAIAAVVRQMTPPQLEAVILFYPPDAPRKMSSIVATAEPDVTGKHPAVLKRARAAASAFVAQAPNMPSFNPQS